MPRDKVFVTHPFKDNPKDNRESVEIICRLLEEQGYLPISPLHLFSFIDEESDEVRDLIMETCRKLISFDADINFAFGSEGGCKMEIEWSKAVGVPVYFKKLIEENGEYKIIDVC